MSSSTGRSCCTAGSSAAVLRSPYWSGSWTSDGSPVERAVDTIGHIPLPTAIKRADGAGDRERYQTVFAASGIHRVAPAAGLHFTPGVLDALAARGVGRTEVTLHVGYGTQPIRVDVVEEHQMEPNTSKSPRRRPPQSTRRSTPDAEWWRSAPRRSPGHRVRRPRERRRIVPGRGSTNLFIYRGSSSVSCAVSSRTSTCRSRRS
ncbi:MAG: S-adenosylmethionine:tRNA ribosyltransferase-isomerase [Vicinamibacterales bacterium]